MIKNTLLKPMLLGIISCCFLILSSTSVYAVDFPFTDTEGENHKLSDYQGKWVVVNYWASWCGPCRKEIPDLSDFHLERDDAIVLGVNYEPGLSDKRLKKFIDVYVISYPVTRVSDDITDALGKPRGLPTSLLINPQGKMVKKITGIVDGKRLNKLIRKYQRKS